MSFRHKGKERLNSTRTSENRPERGDTRGDCKSSNQVMPGPCTETLDAKRRLHDEMGNVHCMMKLELFIN